MFISRGANLSVDDAVLTPLACGIDYPVTCVCGAYGQKRSNTRSTWLAIALVLPLYLVSTTLAWIQPSKDLIVVRIPSLCLD